MGHPIWKMSDVAPVIRRPVEVAETGRYRQIGIRSFGKGIFHKTEATGLEIGTKKIFEILPGDLLFNIVFAWEGAVAVATESEMGMVGSHRFLTCRTSPKIALPRYLYWYFCQGKGLKQLLRVSPGGAGRNRTLNIAKLGQIGVPLPPIEDQSRIVARLDQVERLVNARQATIDAINAEANAMLRSVFDRLIDGAPLRPMAEVAPLVRRPVEIDPDQVYTEIGVKSFYKGIFHRRSVTGAEFSWQKLFWLEKGDIVFSNLMAWEQAIAESFDEDHGCVGNHRMLTCQPTAGLMIPGFLSYFYKTQTGFSEIVKASPGTAARNKTLSPTLLAEISVPTPSLDKQLWFDSLQAKVREMRAVRERASRDATALLPALLHEIFGDVEV
ncbi:restriction endonuclease subunit S [Azospirillum sp.]|uniref:restriction endonuclease subunit S n=1 Tax=Azospirillum sp. TaxID=34012 RepID=UPI002632FEA4|nr:restriction endonuclease subunit S [Azospirillum sp.]